MFRRFYHKLFMKENGDLIKRRFKTLDYTLILERWTLFLQKYLKIKPSHHLAMFLFRILRIKTRQDPAEQGEEDREAINISINMISYSRVRFATVHENKYFWTLFRFIYEGTIPESNKPWIEQLWEFENISSTWKLEEYLDSFRLMYEKWKRTLENQ